MIDFGRGVRLGTINRMDMDLLRGWRNDPSIWKWCRQNDLISEWQQDRWFERQSSDPTIKMYMVERPNGEGIGVCGLTSIDLWNHRAEFSLYIASEWMAQGYGTKALSTLFDHAFLHLGLHLVWGEAFALNPARKLFRLIGMEEEGSRREFYFRDGEYIDAVLYSITDAEWKSCNSTRATSSA